MSRWNVASAKLHGAFLRRTGQNGSGSHGDPRLGVVEVPGHHGRQVRIDRARRVRTGSGIGKTLGRRIARPRAGQTRQGRERGGTHVDVVVPGHAVDRAPPTPGHARPARRQGVEYPCANHRRLVPEQKRRDQVRLVHRLEHLDRVQHPRRVRVRELFHHGFEGGGLAAAGHDCIGCDAARIDAVAERLQVLVSRANRHSDPQPGDGQRGIAQLAPVQSEAPGLHAGQQQDRGHRLREAIHRHVDERLHAVPQLGRQRNEEDLTRGLVQRVAHRRADHAGSGDGP